MLLTNKGRDGALRCPRRVQRRNGLLMLKERRPFLVFRPLDAGGDAAARHPHLDKQFHRPANICQKDGPA
jgi:hypothetical protein